MRIASMPREMPGTARSSTTRPRSRRSKRTVVSSLWGTMGSSESSTPTTLTSSGTRRPASRRAAITPVAIWSFATYTAVMARSCAKRRPTSYPLRALQSPRKGATGSILREASASCHPASRNWLSIEKSGPPTNRICSCPRAKR